MSKSMMIVKQLWVRFPYGFNKYDEFYKSLGDNIPQFSEYEGTGIQKSYCIRKEIDVKDICKKYRITEFSTIDFLTDESKFNNQHKIYTCYKTIKERDDQPYILEKVNY